MGAVAMHERRLIELESEIAEADAYSAAAIAFAAIFRIGALGKAAQAEFAKLAHGANEDPDMRAFSAGLGLISWRLD